MNKEQEKKIKDSLIDISEYDLSYLLKKDDTYLTLETKKDNLKEIIAFAKDALVNFQELIESTDGITNIESFFVNLNNSVRQLAKRNIENNRNNYLNLYEDLMRSYRELQKNVLHLYEIKKLKSSLKNDTSEQFDSVDEKEIVFLKNLIKESQDHKEDIQRFLSVSRRVKDETDEKITTTISEIGTFFHEKHDSFFIELKNKKFDTSYFWIIFAIVLAGSYLVYLVFFDNFTSYLELNIKDDLALKLYISQKITVTLIFTAGFYFSLSQYIFRRNLKETYSSKYINAKTFVELAENQPELINIISAYALPSIFSNPIDKHQSSESENKNIIDLIETNLRRKD